MRTIKESCLERMVLIGEGSLRRAVREFVAHYHHERNRCFRHQLLRFLTQMCARFSPSRSAAPWEEGADALVPANQR